MQQNSAEKWGRGRKQRCQDSQKAGKEKRERDRESLRKWKGGEREGDSER